jgi:hypothetical protein
LASTIRANRLSASNLISDECSDGNRGTFRAHFRRVMW